MAGQFHLNKKHLLQAVSYQNNTEVTTLIRRPEMLSPVQKPREVLEFD